MRCFNLAVTKVSDLCFYNQNSFMFFHDLRLSRDTIAKLNGMLVTR